MRTKSRPHPEVGLAVTPEALIDRHVRDAREQLSEGRERLKAARRRVTQLEEALLNWERLASEMRARRARGATPPSAESAGRRDVAS